MSTWLSDSELTNWFWMYLLTLPELALDGNMYAVFSIYYLLLIHVNVCMYVRMYECMYACMHVNQHCVCSNETKVHICMY